jgi:hypothetical protein
MCRGLVDILMAALFKPKVEGVGEERQDGKPRSVDGRWHCDTYEDWLVVSEVRREADKDPKVKPHDEWPWYHGRMNRSVAEDFLSKSARFDGTFIVRESDAISVRRDPVYVVSVMNDGVPHHVEVDKREDGRYVLAGVEGGKSFKSLKKLVVYYSKKPMDLEGGGKAKLKYLLE